MCDIVTEARSRASCLVRRCLSPKLSSAPQSYKLSSAPLICCVLVVAVWKLDSRAVLSYDAREYALDGMIESLDASTSRFVI